MDSSKLKHASDRFEKWLETELLLKVEQDKPLYSQEVRNPEKYARFRTMFAFVRDAMGERVRRSAYRTHYYDETTAIIEETVAAMMFVEEEIAAEKKKYDQIAGRKNE